MAIKKYPVLVEGEVFLVWVLETDGLGQDFIDRVNAGMSSNPVIMDDQGIDELRIGWTFDGTDWHPPVE
jgi:hypothetical protein